MNREQQFFGLAILSVVLVFASAVVARGGGGGHGGSGHSGGGHSNGHSSHGGFVGHAPGTSNFVTPNYYSGGNVVGRWGGVSNVSNRLPGWYGLYNWPYYYGYGYYGPDYGFGYVPAYCYDNGLAYANDYGQPYEAGYSPAVTYPAPAQPATSETVAPTGEEYITQALEAFQSGDYRSGLLLANHAAVDMPQDPRVHETMSLAMFALKNYRGAAMEAHAALALGSIIDWPTLYGYYRNRDTYTGQLRALEAFVRDNPKAPEGHFLLAYQYLMMGYKQDAKKELTEVTTLAPADKLAQALLKQL